MLNFTEFVTATAGACDPTDTNRTNFKHDGGDAFIAFAYKIAYLVNWFLRRISGLNKIGFPCRRGGQVGRWFQCRSVPLIWIVSSNDQFQ